MFARLKHFFAAVLIVIVAFVSAAGGLLLPTPAHAQLATFTFGSIPDQLKQIGDQIFQAFIAALKVATVRTMAFAVRKIAYDSAVWLASGAKGQNPFAHTEKFGPYLASVVDDTAGTFIEQLGTDKLNLCHLPDVKVDLAMKIGLRTSFGNPIPGVGGAVPGTGKPDCSLSQLASNWGKEWDSKYGAQATIQRFNKIIQVDNSSDLGIQLQTTEKLANTVQQQTAAATLQRQEGKGYKGKESLISNQIQTPPSLIEEQFKANTPDKTTKQDVDTLQTQLASNDPKVLSVALSIFLNTLISTGIQNFRERGVLPTEVTTPGGTATDVNAIPTGGAEIAADFFRELQTVKVSEVTNYDVLSQLSSCPDVPGTYNCRADDDLVTALKKAETGQPITIAQALQGGLLHGDYLLIPPTSAKNKERDSCSRAYCHGNIQVLRQLRIVPLGFEIAALNSDPDHPWTLKKVVDGFKDCTYLDPNDHSRGIVNDPSGHPFCHLIDPNWVLKVPLTKCRAKAPGPFLLTDVPNRLEDCVDIQSCVHYAADGTCDNFGYCAREENTWKFNAEKCDSYAATCRTFTNQTTGQAVSYLYRTLDTGFCSEKNIGCTAYSLSQKGKWLDPVIAPASAGYTNAGIYFNKSVSKSCSAGSAGCSAFLVSGSETNTLLYMKKAPDYLKCYDASPGTPQVDWPQSVADLTRIKLNADSACSNYAVACIKDEVSCSLYSPTVGGDPVPGRFTPHQIVDGQIRWNDECSAACVGYAAYREMPSRYSTGQAVSYIIPSSGARCSAADEGCTGFTNLSTTSGGLEQVEYFSYLRPCIAPEKDKGKTFITYEGSQKSGFQLQTYVLVENQDTANGPVGAPKYFYKDDTELQSILADCTEQRYKAGSAPADCRQFNDEQGHIYYRLLSHTIPVSAACTPYRFSNPELSNPVAISATDCATRQGFYNNGVCRFCLQNGEYRDGSCFYNALPGGVTNSAGVSKVCSAGVDTCRAFKGTGGGVAGQIFNDTFDPQPVSSTVALKDWTGAISWSTESTHSGEHSLQVTGTAVKTVSLDTNASFDLTFWAKGASGVSLSIQLKRTDAAANTLGTVGVGDTWNVYHLGPIEVDGTATSSGSIILTVSGGGSVWVDNVVFNHSAGLLFLVKKSLSVDPACDSNLTDNLPGEALGCSAYTDSNSKPVYLTNFSQLCRAEAIGCTAVLDTKNTVTVSSNGTYQAGDEGPRAYNVWLSGRGGSVATTTVGSDSYTCTVAVGATGCYLDKPILNHTAAEIQAASPARFVTSTIYIPGDTPAAAPIYLVANRPATCNRVDLGCTYAGVAQATPTGVTYVTTTIKNDPATYGAALCQEEAVGCQSYTDSAGAPAYFKDPSAVGQKICSYKTDVVVKGVKTNGWFWKGVGVCTDASKTENGVLCQADTDCASGFTCQNKDNQPCYPDYFENSSTYGLWSYGNVGSYQNFVGECKSSQDKCTEFVDHVRTNIADPTQNIDKAYYLINDTTKLTQGDCAGGVNQKTGCALFDQTDNPNKYWSRDLSYTSSEQKDKTVAPVVSSDATHPNDSNIILKVIPDRQCGEWLQCSHSFPVTDAAGNTKQVCQSLERCDKGTTSEDCGLGVKSEYSNEVLTEGIYRDRDVRWQGKEYDGYSILGMYPVEELVQLNFSSTTSNPDWRLVRRIPCGTGTNSNCAVNAAPTDYSCAGDGLCGGANPGLCINGTCVKEIHGGNDGAAVAKSPAQTCRAYPEKNSPFPNTKRINESPNFSQAKICDESFKTPATVPASTACECNYTKVSYGDILTKYWNYRKPNTFIPILGQNTGVPGGLCQGGDRDGYPCTTDSNCHRLTDNTNSAFLADPLAGAESDKNGEIIVDGVCKKKTASRQFIGWSGFCLEPDKTRTTNAENDQPPCLTWFPIDALEGAPDIYNQHTEAGFINPASGGRLYCLQAEQSYNPGGFKTRDEGGRGNTSPIWYDSNFSNADPAVVTLYNEESDYPTRGHSNFTRGTYPATSLETWITQGDIDRIILKQTGNSEALGPNNVVIPVGASFTVLPNDLTGQQVGIPQSYYLMKTASGVTGQMAIGHYLGSPYDILLLYASGDPGVSTLDRTGYLNYNNGEPSPYFLNGPQGKMFASSPILINNKTVTDPEGIWSTTVTPHDLCSYVGDTHHGAWYAVRLQFDSRSPHRFLKYYFAACSTGEYGGGVPHNISGSFEVTFKLKEWCSKVADATVNIADDDFSASRTVAWTDRLWKQQFKTKQPEYSYDTEMKPYASLSLNTLTPDQQVILSPRDPIVCPDATFLAASPDPTLPNCDFHSKDKPNTPLTYVVGGPYTCTLLSCQRSTSDQQNKMMNFPSTNYPTSQIDFGKQVLGNVFAYLADIWDYDASYKSAAVTKEEIKNYTAVGNDNSFFGPLYAPMPPQIRAVGSCEKERQCIEVATTTAPSFTINDRYNRDIVVRGNSLNAAVKFFAFADKEQMPIRQITVDWDDGSDPSPIPVGYFRNKRGLKAPYCQLPASGTGRGFCTDGKDGAKILPEQSCFRPSDCPTTPQCVPQANGADGKPLTDFDKIEGKTCDTDYFEIVNEHLYCSPSSKRFVAPGTNSYANGGPAGYVDCRNSQNVDFPKGCCVFKPRVQVKDNWGWCNGSCPDTTGAGGVIHPNGGCYDNSWMRDSSGNRLQGATDECGQGLSKNLPHWTTFAGKIILGPTP